MFFKQIMSNRKLRTMLLTLAVGALTVFVSVPAGAKEKSLTKNELKNLINSAEKKADHERIAQYYDAEATKYEEEAKDHADLASRYQKNTSAMPTKYPGGAHTFQHCDSLSKSLNQAAEDARALAAEHREMAKQAK